jgi:molybdopterin synthase sulfur carrier subunit
MQTPFCPMHIRLRFFASLREALGPEASLELPAGACVADARAALCGLSDAHAQALGPAAVLRAAVNQTLCEESQALAEGDELAFFPPVTGG